MRKVREILNIGGRMKKTLRLMAKQKRKWRKRRLKRKRWDGEGGSPVLQLVHAGVGRATDAGDLLTLLPVGQLLGDQLCQQGLSDVQQLVQPEHSVLKRSKQKNPHPRVHRISHIKCPVMAFKTPQKEKVYKIKMTLLLQPSDLKGIIC